MRIQLPPLMGPPWPKSCLTGDSQEQQAYPPSKLKPPGPPKNALKILFASKSVGKVRNREGTKRWKKQKCLKGNLSWHWEWVFKAFPDSITSLSSPNFRLEVRKSAPPYANLIIDPTPGYVPFCSQVQPQRREFFASTLSSPQLGMPKTFPTLSPYNAFRGSCYWKVSNLSHTTKNKYKTYNLLYLFDFMRYKLYSRKLVVY